MVKNLFAPQGWKMPVAALVFALFCIQWGWGQTIVSEQYRTICSQETTLFATAPGHPGTWFPGPGISLSPDPDFPDDNRRRLASDIPVGISEVYFERTNGDQYWFYITRVEPPVYELTGPGIICGSDEITLTLSGSHNDFRYYLYHNGDVYPGAVARNGTGSPLTWDVNQAGSYTVEARMIGNEEYCFLWMEGEVQSTPAPLPVEYELVTPEGIEFCDGLTIPLRLVNSQERVSYQLFYENEPFGGPRSGMDGSPITWQAGAEGNYYVIGTNVDTGCQSPMQNPVTLVKLELPQAFDISPRNASFCSGTGPVEISISGSQSGVNYQLRNLAGNVLDPEPGTGDPITWEVYQGGNYSVLATRQDNQCTALMIYYSNVTELITYSLSAEGDTHYCQGEYGIDLRLSPSSQPGVEYILYKDGFANSSKSGTGEPLVWENMKEGEYRAVATKDGVECDMLNTVTVTEHQYTGSVLPAAPVCLGETVQLSAAGGISYSWIPAEGLSNTTIPDPVASPLMKMLWSTRPALTH